MYVCMNVLSICIYVRMYVCMYVCLYVCRFARMYECTYVCLHICMDVCMNVCNVFMHACSRVYICVCVCACIPEFVHVLICVHMYGGECIRCGCQRLRYSTSIAASLMISMSRFVIILCCDFICKMYAYVQMNSETHT